MAILDVNFVAVLERINTPEAVKSSRRYEVAGLDDLVLELTQEVIVPIRRAGKAKSLGVNPAPGIVLHGIPGTGKTLISKWLAQELETLAKFVKGPELLSPYVGVGETHMRNAFADASAFFNATGKHAIIVFDEAEVAFRKREHHGALSDVSGSLLAQYLGLTGEGASPAIVVMITNHIEMLDEAAYRDGRASVFKVPRPNKDGTLAIAKVHCSKMNASPEIPVFLTERLHTDLVLQTLQAEDGINLPIKAGDIVTGAMVSDILDSSGRDALMQDSDLIDCDHVDRAVARNLRKKAALFQFAAFEEKYGYEILANSSGWKQVFTG
jgi:SpoVK/Ycf46/Vps4 family AAA+-type ATPase